VLSPSRVRRKSTGEHGLIDVDALGMPGNDSAAHERMAQVVERGALWAPGCASRVVYAGGEHPIDLAHAQPLASSPTSGSTKNGVSS